MSVQDKTRESDLAGQHIDRSSLTRGLYSSDASIYRVVPKGVAFPRTRDELVDLARAALAAGTPVTMRGAGTSCGGNAIGTGLVIDVSRHLNRILDIDPVARTATVEPGVVQDVLQRAVAPHGLRFGPDPSSSSRCTIGGMIANDACGPRAMGYGRTSDNIVELEVLTGTGELLTLRSPHAESPVTGEGPGTEASVPTSLNPLKDLVAANLGTIRTELGTFSRMGSGYAMTWLLPEKKFDLARFMASSEGTLGIITKAVVRLVADAPVKQMVALGYASMAEAADAMPTVATFSPTAAEGMDRRIVDVVVRSKGADSVPPLPAGDGWVFVELVGDDAGEVRGRAEAMVAAAGALEAWLVDDPATVKALWRIRSDGAGLAGVSLDRPAFPGWEDASVPVENLGTYLRRFDELLERHGLHGLPYGHFGDGCVHCRIDFPFDRDGGDGAYRRFVEEAADLVASLGGSMSGEHGDGRARSALLPRMFSPQVIDLFGQVKTIFDPDNLLNPGVLVDPRPVAADVRVSATVTSPLRTSHPEFVEAVHQCSGVGKCLADGMAGGQVMCPSFQATRNEKDSTRGRSRILQEMVNGSLISQSWRSPEVHEALDLCLSCKGCARDCPTGIDMAAYKSRVLHESYRGRVRPRAHYSMGWLPRWGRLMGRLPGLGAVANLALKTPGLSHAAKWVAGVDQRRPLPTFRSGRGARRQFARSFAQPGRPEVVIWVDSFVDAFVGQQLASLVQVLESLGYAPRVLQEDACCGLTWITTGQLDGARTQLRRALDVLAPIAESGVPIIGMEPSCMAVWRSDAPELLPDDARVASVAGAILTLAELIGRHDDWVAPDLSGHTIVAQPHCHHASVLGWAADAKVLEATGAEVITLGGCCGLAGNWGVEIGHYETSVAVAETSLLPTLRANPDAIVLADGFSCRKQVSDLERRDSMSLAQLLATHLG
ncbi:FAD-binding and (Fe-S)-binding domain-containing protein [Propionibacteriaceae bacterium Y1923]